VLGKKRNSGEKGRRTDILNESARKEKEKKRRNLKKGEKRKKNQC